MTDSERIVELTERVQELESVIRALLTCETCEMGWPEQGAVETNEFQEVKERARDVLERPEREREERAAAIANKAMWAAVDERIRLAKLAE